MNNEERQKKENFLGMMLQEAVEILEHPANDYREENLIQGWLRYYNIREPLFRFHLGTGDKLILYRTLKEAVDELERDNCCVWTAKEEFIAGGLRGIAESMALLAIAHYYFYPWNRINREYEDKNQA